MKREKTGADMTGTLAVLLIFLIFAVLILAVILFGVKAYRNLDSESEENFDERTAALFLTGKIRQAPVQDRITVGTFGDGDCLFIPEYYDDCTYMTRIYCHKGWLMELFGDDTDDYLPGDGEKLFPADGFSAGMENGKLVVELSKGDRLLTSLTLALRGGAG